VKGTNGMDEGRLFTFSLKLSEFVEGFTWHVYARVGRNETPLFSQDRLDNGEDMRSFSASIDVLQTAIN
jgi:hypothetical protein